MLFYEEVYSLELVMVKIKVFVVRKQDEEWRFGSY